MRDGKAVGIADDVTDAAVFLDRPRWWESALGHSLNILLLHLGRTPWHPVDKQANERPKMQLVWRASNC
jgi:hypothetical protein